MTQTFGISNLIIVIYLLFVIWDLGFQPSTIKGYSFLNWN